MSASEVCTDVNLSSTLLDSYLGKDISEICAHKYTDASLNHCAHFVCHVMNTAVGSTTCRGMSPTKAAGKIGVCIRVHELFQACPNVGQYDSASEGEISTGCFVFVTAKSGVNLAAKTMVNVPKKHVGIGLNGTIWHYSNTQGKVVTATPEVFRVHYKNQTNGLYYGTFPKKSFPSSFGCEH